MINEDQTLMKLTNKDVVSKEFKNKIDKHDQQKIFRTLKLDNE